LVANPPSSASAVRWGVVLSSDGLNRRCADACCVAAAGLLLGTLFLSTPLASAAPGQAVRSPVQLTEQLQQEKLREEIRQLRLENNRQSGARGFFSTYTGSLTALAGFVTALVAIGGLILTIRQQGQEAIRQRGQEQEQRERDRQQHETDSRRHLDEQFSTILNGLGAASEAIQAGSAVALMSFLRTEQSAYHHQVRLATLANLKVEHPSTVTRILVNVLEEAFRTTDKLDGLERDLSHAQLPRIDLSGVDLSDCDLAFAQLGRANLVGAVLSRASGYRVNLDRARCGKTNLEAARLQEGQCVGTSFQEARMVAVHLEDATLTDARFQRANLNAAHLERAELAGAHFEDATLADTYFVDRQGNAAHLDEAAMRSIVRARGWRNAHFSKEHWAQLENLADGNEEVGGPTRP
jgi:uncharacterized protein YjbI with pentapeptide repeats